jgi:hypothetical protein
MLIEITFLTKKYPDSKRKRIVGRVALVYIFANVFKIWLKEASWILISASVCSC